MSIIDDFDFKEKFPRGNTGNTLLDVYFQQKNILDFHLDKIIQFYGDDKNSTYDLLSKIYILSMSNDVLQHISLEKEKLNTEIIDLASSYIDEIIDASPLETIRNMLPIGLEDRFYKGLAQYFVLNEIISSEIKGTLTNGDDEILNEKILNWLPYMANISYFVGELTLEFMQVASRFFNDKVSGIQSKETSIQSKGGQIRAEKYNAVRERARKLFKEGNYRSYTDFANQEFTNFNVSFDTLKRYVASK